MISGVSEEQQIANGERFNPNTFSMKGLPQNYVGSSWNIGRLKANAVVRKSASKISEEKKTMKTEWRH